MTSQLTATQFFCGIHLNWDYENRTVNLNIPNYVTNARAQLHHPDPVKPHHSPHPYQPPVFGQKTQYAKPSGTKCQLTPAQLLYCQKFSGFFNYYGCTIDSTMQTAVSSIGSAVSTASWKELNFRINHFLDYAATHPDAHIQYRASQMHLWLHSDASYLNAETKARSRNGGFV